MSDRRTVEIVYTWPDGREEVRYRAPENSEKALELISQVIDLELTHRESACYSYRYVGPTPSAGEGEDVYLARFLRWLASQPYNTEITIVSPGYDGSFMVEVQDNDCIFLGQSDGVHHTCTLAPLRACQSARVQPICAIFGEES